MPLTAFIIYLNSYCFNINLIIVAIIAISIIVRVPLSQLYVHPNLTQFEAYCWTSQPK